VKRKSAKAAGRGTGAAHSKRRAKAAPRASEGTPVPRRASTKARVEKYTQPGAPWWKAYI
jgi:hypothetical protein